MLKERGREKGRPTLKPEKKNFGIACVLTWSECSCIAISNHPLLSWDSCCSWCPGWLGMLKMNGTAVMPPHLSRPFLNFEFVIQLRGCAELRKTVFRTSRCWVSQGSSNPYTPRMRGARIPSLLSIYPQAHTNPLPWDTNFASWALTSAKAALGHTVSLSLTQEDEAMGTLIALWNLRYHRKALASRKGLFWWLKLISGRI